MGRYTVETTFTFDKVQEYRGLVPDTGATLTVGYWNGVNYTNITSVTSPINLFTKGMNIRITPSGGGFLIEDGFGV